MICNHLPFAGGWNLMTFVESRVTPWTNQVNQVNSHIGTNNLLGLHLHLSGVARENQHRHRGARLQLGSKTQDLLAIMHQCLLWRRCAALVSIHRMTQTGPKNYFCFAIYCHT